MFAAGGAILTSEVSDQLAALAGVEGGAATLQGGSVTGARPTIDARAWIWGHLAAHPAPPLTTHAGVSRRLVALNTCAMLAAGVTHKTRRIGDHLAAVAGVQRGAAAHPCYGITGAGAAVHASAQVWGDLAVGASPPIAAGARVFKRGGVAVALTRPMFAAGADEEARRIEEPLAAVARVERGAVACAGRRIAGAGAAAHARAQINREVGRCVGLSREALGDAVATFGVVAARGEREEKEEGEEESCGCGGHRVPLNEW